MNLIDLVDSLAHIQVSAIRTIRKFNREFQPADECEVSATILDGPLGGKAITILLSAPEVEQLTKEEKGKEV